MIDEEWKRLVKETQGFENLKMSTDGRICFDVKKEKILEKLSQIEENALDIEKQHNLLDSMKKRIEEDADKLRDEWKRLDNEKKEFFEKQEEFELQLKLLNKEKSVLKENRFYINNLVPKFQNLF